MILLDNSSVYPLLLPLIVHSKGREESKGRVEMSVCDTSRHQPTQQRNTVRLAWQRILALHTLIHNMNYSHNPQGPDAIFISSTSSFNLSLFTRLCHFFFFVLTFSPISPVFSVLCPSPLPLFPTPLLFLSRRLKGPSAQRRWGPVLPGAGATGGEVAQEERRGLSVWRMEGWVCVWMLGEKGHWWALFHWWNKDQVGCTWELWFSIAGGETREPGHTLACVLFAARQSQSPLLSCITNIQGVEEEAKPTILFTEQYLHSALGLCKVCKSF